MLSAKLLQCLAQDKLDEAAADKILSARIASQELTELYDVFKSEVWPQIDDSLHHGEVQSKAVAIQLLQKILNKLMAEGRDERIVEDTFAVTMLEKLIAKSKDLSCLPASVETILSCFV